MSRSAASADEDDFTIHNREDIVGILRDLSRTAATLSAVFNGGSEVLLTAVLAVDPEAGIAYLDTNANKENNQRLLSSRRTFFVAMGNGVTVQWVCGQLQDAEFEGRHAFRIPIPDTLRRIQRRGVYRVTTPIASPVFCRVPLKDGREVDLALVDIGVEGIGVLLPIPEEPDIQRGARFAGCTIALPDTGTVRLGLKVQSVWEMTLVNGTKSHRAGFEFVAFQPGDQSLIQRYVNKLDSQRIATMRDR